jgi:hypothetical protein
MTQAEIHDDMTVNIMNMVGGGERSPPVACSVDWISDGYRSGRGLPPTFLHLQGTGDVGAAENVFRAGQTVVALTPRNGSTGFRNA